MKLSRVLGTVLTALPALAAAADHPLIVAHRGSSYTAPENTVASAKLAWKQNADIVEVDVHLSADNRVIVIHDSTTSRTTGKNYKVSETNSSVLRTLDAGSWKHPRYAGEKLPFLDEVLPTVPKGKKIFVEIKSSKEIVPYVRDLIREAGKEEEAVIIGFNIETMAEAKKAMPHIPVYWLKSTEKDEATSRPIPHSADLVEKVKKHNLDGLDLHYEGVTEEIVKAAHAAGLGLHVWTVDDPQEARRLKALGVDSITTNRPALIRRVLEGKPAQTKKNAANRKQADRKKGAQAKNKKTEN